jgi:hypothetical protein
MFDACGKPELADHERARAQVDREGAAADLERARLRHERIASDAG